MSDSTHHLLRLNIMEQTPLIVFYDGSCPLCLREIGVYQRRSDPAVINWVDVSTDAMLQQTAPGLTCEQAMARFHVLDHGKLYSGAEAFVRLWQNVPGFVWLGRLTNNRLGIWIGERLYRLFLRFRPRLQRLVWGAAS